MQQDAQESMYMLLSNHHLPRFEIVAAVSLVSRWRKTTLRQNRPHRSHGFKFWEGVFAYMAMCSLYGGVCLSIPCQS